MAKFLSLILTFALFAVANALAEPRSLVGGTKKPYNPNEKHNNPVSAGKGIYNKGVKPAKRLG